MGNKRRLEDRGGNDLHSVSMKQNEAAEVAAERNWKIQGLLQIQGQNSQNAQSVEEEAQSHCRPVLKLCHHCRKTAGL